MSSRAVPSTVDFPKTPDTPVSSTLSAKLPFFEKYKNKLPGGTTTDTRAPNGGDIRSPRSTPVPAGARLSDQRRVVETEGRNSTPKPESRSRGESQPDKHRRNRTADKADPLNFSPSSGSEIGLAYADSTDYSDSEKDKVLPLKPRTKKAPPPPLNLPNIPGQVKFPLLSQKETKSQSLKKKTDSSSSGTASVKGPRGPDRDSSESVARTVRMAQGDAKNQTSQARPIGLDVDKDRIASASSMQSALSAGSGSIYSKSSDTGTGLGGLNTRMETLLEDISIEVGPRSTQGASLNPGSPLIKSKSASALASSTNGPTSGAVKAQRSNTVTSPETKAPKLPTRSITSPTYQRDSSKDSSRTRGVVDEKSVESVKERAPNVERKAPEKRKCIRCETTLVDKRWVQMDGGSVLCEKCWKNMYLPKVGFYF